MGCNCGKKNSTKVKGGQQQSSETTQTFRLQMPDGRSFDFGSRLEAEAQRVRWGYTGRIVAF